VDEVVALLHVTPKVQPSDATRQDTQVPDEIVDLLRLHGEVLTHGWSRTGEQPWRMQWQVKNGRVAATLAGAIRELGYDTSTFVWPKDRGSG
jgi:hypothetical protein